MAAVIEIDNIPKPVRDIPPIRMECRKCGMETEHFLFTTDPSYFGPIILYPASKLFPKHNHLVCVNCLATAEISEDKVRILYKKPRVKNQKNDLIQDAMHDLYKRLVLLSEKREGYGSDAELEAIEHNTIAGYRNRLADIENEEIKSATRICPYCQESVKYAAIKCRYCLSELEPLLPKTAVEKTELIDLDSLEVIYCELCYHENIFGNKVCSSCGHVLYYGNDE